MHADIPNVTLVCWCLSAGGQPGPPLHAALLHLRSTGSGTLWGPE